MIRLSLLTLLLALPAYAHAAPVDPAEHRVRERVEHIETDLDAWDVAGARGELTELEKVFAALPDAQPVELMPAKVAFFEGRYPESAALYAKAGASARDGSYRKLAEDALAETKDDLHQASAHFDLYFPPGKDAILAPYALDTLERAFTALSADLAYTPEGRIRVEILPDDEALARLSTLTIEQIRTTGTIAICKFNRLMIISPRALLHGYDWRDTLNHELTHFFVSMKSRNTVPIWLHEGLAKYEETRWRGEGGLAMTPASEALLGEAVRKKKLITFEQMHPSMALLPSQEDAATAFAEVFHAIEFLKAKGGTAMWNTIIANLKAGEDYQGAVAHAYHAPFPRFVADWKVFLRSRKYPAGRIPLANEKLAFKSAAARSRDAIEATQLDDFGDVADPEARNFAHLGGLLLQRNHPRAAVEELGKAYARAGDPSPMLSNKYAEALLGSNQLAEAAKVLDASAALHPGFELTEVHLGEVLLGLKDYARARDHFLRGVDTDPFDPRLHQGLAAAYDKLGDAPKAEQAKQALAILRGADQPAPTPLAPTGELLLATHPFAEVTVDGHPLGRTTPTTLELPVGKHHLRLVNAERGLTKELDVTVQAGQSQELRLELADPRPADP